MSDTEYKVSAQDFHYLSRVRRLKKGESLDLIVDGAFERSVEIVSLENERLVVKVLSEQPVETPVTADITLIQGLPKQDKFSEILNGCTQIGVSRFYPVEMSRSIVTYSDKQKQKKLERWCDVVRSASLQSFQIRQPYVEPVKKWSSFIQEFKCEDYDFLLVAWEDESGKTLKSALSSVDTNNPKIALVIGPEGGLSSDEVEQLQRKGFVSVTLGGTILRTEVAGLVGCSQIMYHF